MKAFFQLAINWALATSLASAQVTSISTGSYLGECVGYCINEIRIEQGLLTEIKSTWDGSLPEVVSLTEIDEKDFQSLSSSLNLTLLESLPNRIGEPDAFDQGGFWIEIRTSTEATKVVYEKGKEPLWLKEVADQMTALAKRNVESNKSSSDSAESESPN